MAGYAIFLLVFVGVLLYVGRVLWVHKDEHNLPHPIQPQLHKRLFVEPSPPKGKCDCCRTRDAYECGMMLIDDSRGMGQHYPK